MEVVYSCQPQIVPGGVYRRQNLFHILVTLLATTEWMTACPSLIYSSYLWWWLCVWRRNRWRPSRPSYTRPPCDGDFACDDGIDDGPPVPHILVLPVMVTLRVTTEWMTARPSLIYSSYLWWWPCVWRRNGWRPARPSYTRPTCDGDLACDDGMDDGPSVPHHEEPLGLGEDLSHVGAGLEGERVLVAQHLRRRAVPNNRLCSTTATFSSPIFFFKFNCRSERALVHIFSQNFESWRILLWHLLESRWQVWTDLNGTRSGTGIQ